VLRLSSSPRYFKKALSLFLPLYRLPFCLTFPASPVPDHTPGNFCRFYQVQVLLGDVGSLVWRIHQLSHFHQFPCAPAPIPVGSCNVLSVSPRIDGSPRLIWIYLEAVQSLDGCLTVK
jgi:hypothetical protein